MRARRTRPAAGIVIVANKWDLMKQQGPDAYKVFDENVRYQLKFLDYAPILHISAKTGERTPKLLETIDKVARRAPAFACRRPSSIASSARSPRSIAPVSPGHRNVRVLFAAQTGVAPPAFVLFTNVATKLHFSYQRYLENQLREAYGFVGTPIRIAIRKRSREPGDRPKR